MPTHATSRAPASRRNASTLAVDGGAPVADPPVPFVSVRLEEADVERALDAMRSGMLAQGRNVQELENRFAEMTGARHAVACANGTCALQLAYEPLFEPADEVLVPAWTYIATASMIVARGAVPVFVDADPETYNIDADAAAQRVTARTRAIAATHLYGNPADVRAIEALAQDKGLRVIYDAAQAHFATAAGEGLGAFGDAVTYSFYPTKNMTTGEGGMVTTNNDELAKRLRLLRSHGETQKYLHEVIGYNYRMTDVEAAVGLSQLDRVEALTERRRANAARLDEIVGAIDGLRPPATTPGGTHVYHQYAVRMDLDRFECDRDRFVEALRAEGVGAGVHYPRALTQQPCFETFVDAPMPVSERLASSLLCLPVHPALDDRQIGQIGEALAKVADAYRR